MRNIKEISIPRFIYSLLLNVAVLLIALFVFVPFFEEIDDTHISMIAEGAYGLRDWHLIYVNVILGKVYQLFISILPNIRWHTVIQYFFIFFAYLTSTYVISKHKYGPILSFLAVISTFYELYVSLQYTKTAAFVTCAGVLLLFEHVRDNTLINNADKNIVEVHTNGLKIEKGVFTAIGIIFIAYGAMLRFEAAVIACIPLFFVGVLELIRSKLIFKYIKVFVPAFALVAGLYFVNSYAYKSNAEWNEYTVYNKARTTMVDYRYDILYYPENGDNLKKMGVTENDALMIVTYQYADDDIFNTEYLKNLNDSSAKRPFNLKVFRMMWGNIREELKRFSVEIPALILLIVLLIATIVTERSRSHSESIKDANNKLVAMIFMGLFCGAALIYFQYSGRWSHRLVGSLVIPTIYAICYMLDGGVIFDNTRGIKFGGNLKDISMELIIVTIVIVLGFNVLNCINNKSDYLNDKKKYSEGKELLDSISKDGDNLYVFDTFTFQYSFEYDVFRTYREGELKNFVSCGSWFTNSPITNSLCRNFGYDNPYEAIRNNKGNVYLIDNFYPDEKALFLTQHYDGEYNAIHSKTVNGFDFYSLEN